MKDLDLAKNVLCGENLTLVVVKNGKVLFRTDAHSISSFLGAISKLGAKLEDASVADHIVGKAIALLCVYKGVSDVYADVLSRKAKALFEEYGIPCECKVLVDNILNLKRSDICPFEKAAADISDPEKAFVVFKGVLQSFKDCK
jgi:hypothetical protein